MLSCKVFCIYTHTQIDSPKKATRWGVRVAVKCWVLRSQQEGEDSSSACTERVADYHQPIVHGALVLWETARVISLAKAQLCHHSEHNHFNKLPRLLIAEFFSYSRNNVNSAALSNGLQWCWHKFKVQMNRKCYYWAHYTLYNILSLLPSLFQMLVTRSFPAPVSS